MKIYTPAQLNDLNRVSQDFVFLRLFAQQPLQLSHLSCFNSLWSRGRSLAWQGGSARHGGQPGLHIRPSLVTG
jgi:hypothetical protein